MTAPEPPGLWMRILIVIGGVGLLLAVATDGLAVIGRHIGRPLLGSIEIVQAAVLLAASVAMVIATVERRHAVVHVLVNRLDPKQRDRVARVGSALGALLFAALLAGSIWMAVDMADGHEESDLLRIPFGPLRLISIASLATVTVLFGVQAIRGPKA